MSQDTWISDDIPLGKPNAARMYDYLLGGYHNFAIDRKAAEQLTAIAPDSPLIMQVNRAFLRRVVKYLVGQGIDQFLDLGSGIPTAGNVHEVAQELNPTAHVVYVDNDPVAVSHSLAILQGNPYVTTVQGDVRQIDQLVQHLEVRQKLDFSRPIGVLLLFLLHFVTDNEQAYNLVHTVRDLVPSGSYFAITHGTYENAGPDVAERVEGLYARSPTPTRIRSRAEIAVFFEGLEMIEPGLVYSPVWRAEGPEDLFLDTPQRAHTFGGVAYKPSASSPADPTQRDSSM